MSREYASIIDEAVKQSHEDYVGLWWIVHLLQSANVPEKAIRTATLSVVEQLLQREGIVAGQFFERQFRAWRLQPKDAAAKIDSEWSELGHEPSIGDIVWFTHRDYARTHTAT